MNNLIIVANNLKDNLSVKVNCNHDELTLIKKDIQLIIKKSQLLKRAIEVNLTEIKDYLKRG